MLVCPEGRTQGQPDLLQSSSNIYVPCQLVTERARSAMLGTAWSTASSTTGLSCGWSAVRRKVSSAPFDARPATTLRRMEHHRILLDKLLTLDYVTHASLQAIGSTGTKAQLRGVRMPAMYLKNSSTYEIRTRAPSRNWLPS